MVPRNRYPPLTIGAVAAVTVVVVVTVVAAAAAVRVFRLVEVGGLKAVLPVFMGRGAARKLRQKVIREPCTRRIIKLPLNSKREARTGVFGILMVSVLFGAVRCLVVRCFVLFCI